MKDALAQYLLRLLHEIVALDTTYILLAVLIVMVVIVLDSLGMHSKKIREATGIAANTAALSVDGAKSIKVRSYVSDIQGLAGRPDALIVEHGFVIPIERKPTANKIRDRYIAQLLVYMRLVEEFEGKKPPYGYLILGSACRRIKVMNSPEKQAWLQHMIDEMQSVLAGAKASATPHPKKCQKCEVRESCDQRYVPRSAQNNAANSLLARRAT